MSTSPRISGWTGIARAVRVLVTRVRAWSGRLRLSPSTVVAAALVIALGIGFASVGLVASSAVAESTGRHDLRVVTVQRAVIAALTAVQRERAASAEQPGDTAGYAAARAGADSALAALPSLLPTVDGLGDAAGAVRAQLARLAARPASSSPVATVLGYSALTGALLDLDAALVARTGDPQVTEALAVTHDLAQAEEAVSRQQALLDIGLNEPTSAGSASAAATVDAAVATTWLDQFAATATAGQQAAYAAAVPVGALDAWRAAAAAVLGERDAPHGTLSAQRWQAASQPVVTGLQETVASLAATAFGLANAGADAATAGLYSWGLLLSAAVLLTSLLIRRRRAATESLHAAVLDIAEQQLPEALVMLRDGRAAGVRLSGLPAAASRAHGPLVHAFQAACDQAMTAAADHATMRMGYYAVFVNMFRRSQALLQRQLRLVEQLEHDERSTERLEKLFQIDHLVTRMRRNNENVLILSGTELVRKAAKPVPLSSAIQAAISEIDQYQRVDVVDVPTAKIIDSAASDLIRMLAELLDNATSFSAPDTRVTVAPRLLRDGSLTITAVDSGIGMSDEQIRAANDRLTQLSSTELAKSRRVGLLVVGRLAGRQGFQVTLLGGDDSVGVTAVISVPAELVIEADRPGRLDRRPALNAALARRKSVAARRPEQRAPGAGRGGVARPLVHSQQSLSMARAAAKSLVPPVRQTGLGTMTEAARTLDDEQIKQLVERAHADVPTELPVRTPNRRPGKPVTGNATATASARQPVAAMTARRPATAAVAAPGWFLARDGSDARRPAVGDQPPNWQSPADEGWRVVATISRADRYPRTEEGLPQRRPGAALVPGNARWPTSGRRASAATAPRDPERIRDRLSGIQQGIQRAKGNNGQGRVRRAAGWHALGPAPVTGR